MRKMRKYGAFLFLFGVSVFLFLLFGGVLSRAEGEILIGSASELRKIGTENAYPLDGNYRLTADIDLSKDTWTGIGGKTGFSGTFDGDGHVINGMHAGSEKFAYSLKDNHAWGLFPILNEGATVKNLIFRNVHYNGVCTETNTAVGTVAGYTNQNNVTIENVAVLSGTLNASCVRQTRVGGIIGVARSSDGTLIRNCYNGALVQGDYTSDAGNCYLSLGGIAGFYSSTSVKTGIRSCFNAGKIIAKKTSGTDNFSSVGAIAAYANTESKPFGDIAVISNCYTLVDSLEYAVLDSERIQRFASELNPKKVKEIPAPIGGIPSLYEGFLAASNDAWTVSEGYLPMLTPYASHAVSVAGSMEVEEYGNAVLRERVYVSSFLKEEDVKNAVMQGLGSLFAVNSCTLELSASSYRMQVSFTDGKKTYSVLREGSLQVPTLSYQFDREEKGIGEGTVTVTDGQYVENASYALCWGTENGPLTGYIPLAGQEFGFGDLLVKDPATGTLVYKTPESLLIPPAATHLWLTESGNSLVSYEIPAERRLTETKPLYTFGLVSDPHFGSEYAPAGFKAAMDVFQSTASFVMICGDITEGGSAAQYKVYTDLYTKNKYTLPVWVTLGNHDILAWNLAKSNGKLAVKPKQAYENVKKAFPTFANPDYADDAFQVTVGNTETTKGCENYQMDYTMSYGDDLYIFLCVGPQQFPNEQTSPKQPEALSTTQIVWLNKTLNDYYNVQKKTGRVFLLFHYYIAETGMDMSEEFAKWDAVSSSNLHGTLRKYPDVIHFGGHNHLLFDDDENIYDDTYTSVHVPTLTKGAQGHYEGYLVERYADSVMIKGYDFATKQYVPQAMFLIPQKQIESTPSTDSSDATDPTTDSVSDSVTDPATDPATESGSTSVLQGDGNGGEASSSLGWVLGIVFGVLLLGAGGVAYYRFAWKKKKTKE